MKFRYVVTVEAESDPSYYAPEDDPLEVERGNAPDIVAMALEDGDASISVQMVDD